MADLPEEVRAFQGDLRPVPDPMKLHRLTGSAFNAGKASARENVDAFLAADLVEQVGDVWIFPVGQSRVALQDAKATRAQMGRGELLAEPAESAAAIVKGGRKGLRRSRCAVCGHATATLRSPWDALLLELG